MVGSTHQIKVIHGCLARFAAGKSMFVVFWYVSSCIVLSIVIYPKPLTLRNSNNGPSK